MRSETSFENNIYHIKLLGHFTNQDRDLLREIDNAVKNNHIETIKFDFSELKFIDTGAVGILLLIRDMAQERDIAVEVSNIQGEVKTIFEKSELLRMFNVIAD